MTRVQEVEQMLAKLSDAERAAVLHRALGDGKRSFPGILSSPSVNGGDPCIVRTRIPVWLVESLRRQGASDADILQAYPQLYAQDLVNAWAYVDAHRDEIDRQITEHEAA